MSLAQQQPGAWSRRLLYHLGTQFGNPRGPLGAFLGKTIFARGNAAFNRWVTQQLDVQPDSHILEVGSGPGLTLRALAVKAPAGRVVGVDRSPVMVEQARRRNLAAVRAGRLTVFQGSSDALPFDDASFDLVVAIHVLYFWPDASATLQELRRVLRNGGEVAIGFVLRDHAPKLTQDAFALTGARLAASAEAVEALLRSAGYADIHILANGHGGYCAVGRKGE
jgi:ubiquinone/menaquinone biosynthesis C-methylase UbiE